MATRLETYRLLIGVRRAHPVSPAAHQPDLLFGPFAHRHCGQRGASLPRTGRARRPFHDDRRGKHAQGLQAGVERRSGARVRVADALFLTVMAMADHGVVGRSAELAAVDALLEAREGSAALVLEGEPGIGKTTVWQRALRQAEELGACVLSCRPAAVEAKFSFAALTDLLSPIDSHAFEVLPGPQRHALEVALLRSPTGEHPIAPRAGATGLANLLRHLAAARLVLLAIDDAQWLDGPSRRALEFAFRRLGDEKVRLLYSLRPSGRALELGSAVRERRVVLGPLPLSAIGRIVAEDLERPLPRSALVRVWEVSRGNPFYALELGRLLSKAGVGHGHDVALPVPAELSEIVVERVRRLPARSRGELLLAAVLSAPGGDVVDLGALGPATAQRIVDIGEGGRVVFTHPLFASAVWGAASGSERRAAHRRAAELVVNPEERARDLALAAEGPDPFVAAELDKAAEAAGGRAAPDTAAEFAELAAQLTPAPDTANRAARRLRAGWWHLDAGDLEQADALAQEAYGQAQGSVLGARALQLSAHVRWQRSSFADAVRLASAALAIPGSDDALRVGIEQQLAFCYCQMGDSTAAAAHAAAAARHAQAGGDQEQLAEALAAEAWCRFMDGSGLHGEPIARALELEQPQAATVLLFRPTCVQGNIALLTQQFQQARQSLGEVLAQAVERGEEADLPYFQFHLAEACLWSGDVAAASGYAESALEAAGLLDSGAALGSSLFARALVDAYEGRTTQALQEASRAIAIFRETQFQVGLVFAATVVGFAQLSAGNPGGTHRILGPLTAQMVGSLPRRSLARSPGELGCGDPGFFPFLPDEVEALIHLGELDLAETYLAPFEQSALDLDRPWALATSGRLRGALYAVRAEPDLADASFDRALAAHERLQMPFERGRTLLLAGRAYRRFKRHDRAVEALQGAMRVFEDLGAPLWADKARQELARTGRSAVGSLTETERLCARLAADGLSNLEIAARAFVSVKTVEANLSRVYRKLGLRSRASLASAIDAEGQIRTDRVD